MGLIWGPGMGHLGELLSRFGRQIELSEIELGVGLELGLEFKLTLELGSIKRKLEVALEPELDSPQALERQA